MKHSIAALVVSAAIAGLAPTSIKDQPIKDCAREAPEGSPAKPGRRARGAWGWGPTRIKEDQPIKWSVELSGPARELRPGQTFTVRVTASIREGWHLYALSQPPGGPVPTRISVPPGQPFSLSGPVKGPKAESTPDPYFGLTTEFFEESATFTVPIKVDRAAAPGPQTLEVQAYFQACDDRICLRPQTAKLRLALAIEAGKARRSRGRF